jgi:hypothetical protein
VFKKIAIVTAILMAPSAMAQTSPARNAPPPTASAGLPSAPPTLAVLRKRDLATELRLFGKWWPGIYDNHEQVIRQSGNSLLPLVDGPFRRVHIDVAAIPGSPLGETVFAVSEHQGNAARTLTRNELIAAAPDVAENAIRLKRYRRSDGPGTTDAAKLGMADVVYLGAQCDWLVRFEGGQFVGGVASPKCAGTGGASEYQLIVGPRYVWERDQSRDLKSGKVTWEMAPGTGYDWHQATRARRFTCSVFQDPKGQMATAQYLTTIHLDDQGGEAEMAWPDGRTLMFTIHQRAFATGSEHEYPLFRVHEKGNPVPIAYAYSQGESDDFGLNLGWFYVRCAADKPPVAQGAPGTP